MTFGPDGVSAFLLRYCAVILATPLTIIFNLILNIGDFPAIWRRAKICRF